MQDIVLENIDIRISQENSRSFGFQLIQKIRDLTRLSSQFSFLKKLLCYLGLCK